MTLTPRFLLDANFSSRSRHWQQPEFESAPDHWDDHTVWQYAAEHKLIIVTKDVDFEERALRSAPPQVVAILHGQYAAAGFPGFSGRSLAPHRGGACPTRRAAHKGVC